MMSYVKGAGLKSGLEWIGKTYGPQYVEKMIASFPAEHREAARSLLPSSWYPTALLAAMYESMPTSMPVKDRADLERFVKDLNRAVAESNLSTFYKAVFVLMTPDRLFETLPRIWSLYFKGIEVQTVRDPSAKRGICRVHGLGHVPHFAPAAIGWLEFAFKKVGGTLRSAEEGWAKGRDRSEPLVYHLDWS